VSSQANVKLASGIPFISDADLEKALTDAGASKEVTNAVLDENKKARVDGLRLALTSLALVSLLALFASRRMPTKQPGSTEAKESDRAP
jgi:hypothetical protein